MLCYYAMPAKSGKGSIKRKFIASFYFPLLFSEPEKTETAKEGRRSNDGNAVVENILGDIGKD